MYSWSPGRTWRYHFIVQRRTEIPDRYHGNLSGWCQCPVLIYGIFQIVAGVKKFQDSKGKAILAIVCGVLSIIVSIIAFTHPVLTMFSVGYMIAFAVLMQGINMIVLAVNFGKESE